MRSNVRHKYFERRGRGRPVTLTPRSYAIRATLTLTFFIPFFFFFLINQRALSQLPRSKVRDSADASSAIVLIYNRSRQREVLQREGTSRRAGGSQTTRNNLNPRRRLHGVFVIPGKINPTKVKFARERELDCPRFSRALCSYASSGLAIESDVRTEPVHPRDSITSFETFGTHEHEFRAFARRARRLACATYN